MYCTRFRAALIGPTQGLLTTSTVPLEKPETLRVRSDVDVICLVELLQSGEGIEWFTADPLLKTLHHVPFFYLLACTFCYCFVLFVFVLCSCSRWSFVRSVLSHFHVHQTTYLIGIHVYYWVWLTPNGFSEEHNNITTLDKRQEKCFRGCMCFL